MKKLLNKKILKIALIVIAVLFLGYKIFTFVMSERVVLTEFDQIYKESSGFTIPKIVSFEKIPADGEKGKDSMKTGIVYPEGKTAINNLAYWDNWEWDKKLIKLETLNISTENNTVKAGLILPTDSNGLASEKEYKLECKAEETTVVYFRTPSNRNEEQKGAIEKLVTGDLFYAYCLDPECNSIGRRCIIER